MSDEWEGFTLDSSSQAFMATASLLVLSGRGLFYEENLD